MNPELQHKLKQVRQLLKANGAEAALLGLTSNFSWLACGGEAHVPLNTDRAFGHLVVTPKDFIVLANRIEMPRLEAEVLKGLGARPIIYDWFDGSGLTAFKKIANPRKTISDCGDFGTQSKPGLIHPLHYSLLPQEVRRLKALGRAAESALNETCRELQPGWTEFQIAGHLAERCWERNLTPIVLLVATDERTRNFRHPQVSRKKLRKHAKLVLSARQHGLIVPMTRIVHFGKLSHDLRDRHDAVCLVDSTLHLNTRVGTPIGEIFERAQAAYREVGFADEWKLHHQGGPCGYLGRDYLGSPTASGVVLPNQPFAWNPSITGSKSEDTILATVKGPQVITEARDWPMVTIEMDDRTWQRPDILIR